MNDTDRQVLRTAAERLLAVADGATLEHYSGAGVSNIGAWEVRAIGGDLIRIRPPAAPVPSQAVIDVCERLGVEPWKLARYDVGDSTLYPGSVTAHGVCQYGFYHNHNVRRETYRQPNGITALYWHVRPIAQAKPPELTPWALDPKHAGKVVVRKNGAGCGMVVGVRDCEFIVTGCGKVTPAELLRDWTHMGKPCGEVAK